MKQSFLTAAEAKARVLSGDTDGRLRQFYGVSGKALQPYRRRIADAVDRFTAEFGTQPLRIFSVSGRTELGGNHTDHQHGNVLAAGISPDIIAVAAKDDGNTAQVHSEGYPEYAVSLLETEPDSAEAGTSAALVRGIAARFGMLGKPVHGFAVYMTSNVCKGSGMSSSAAFEVMLCTICNEFFAGNAFSPVDLAKIAQYAENRYFGKPCGLMDQTACALGGVCMMDFSDPQTPVLRQLPLDLEKEGYVLCIIDSGADHAGLTDEYAAVPAEMSAVAEQLGASVLREIPEERFWAELPALRRSCGDRAVLRAAHFFGDSARVVRQAEMLEQGDFAGFLELVRESGRSSAFALQNLYAAGSTRQQSLAVTLALCEKLLDGAGACRVHGGGFAGTVQAYVLADRAEAFCAAADAVLGDGACHVIQLRSCGAAALWDE